MAVPQATQSNLQLLVGDAASPVETFTEIDGVGSIQLSQDAGEIDVTHLNSTSREFLGGLPSRTLQCSGFYDGDDAQQTTVNSAYIAGSTIEFQLKFALESPIESWAFSAVCTSFNIGGETEGAATFDFTLRITGSPTITNQ